MIANKKEYIKRIFTDLKTIKTEGIYLSGIKGEGEYKEWHYSGQIYEHSFYKNGFVEGEYKVWYDDDGQLSVHCWFKNGKREGERKRWENGQLRQHEFYKGNKKIRMPDNIKDGYILGGDGKYYKD